MKTKLTIVMLASTIILTGCTSASEYFEAKTNGVRNSKWVQLSPEDQNSVEMAFHEKQRLNEQLKLNALMRKQSKKIAKAERKNQANQKRRLNQEHTHLKQEQEKNTQVLEGIVNPTP